MTLSGIFRSPRQKRVFLVTTVLMLTVFVGLALVLAQYAPENRAWNLAIDLLVSLSASGVFAIFGALYLDYLFSDPSDIDKTVTVLPQDIGSVLREIALAATEYRIFVRTGRHFRAEILPLLIKGATNARRPIRIDVILLDCRDDSLCDKYETYRRTYSFDKNSWGKGSVQKEVLGTILCLQKAALSPHSLVEINLFLSKRLSAFRIEGSAEEILVTCEDPKDTASRYTQNHRHFGVYLSEFSWIRDDSEKINLVEAGQLVPLSKMFGEGHPLLKLEGHARKLDNAPSPYAR